MDALPGGQAETVGRVYVTYVEILDPTMCQYFSCETRGERAVLRLGTLFPDADIKGSFISVVLEDEKSDQCYVTTLDLLCFVVLQYDRGVTIMQPSCIGSKYTT